MKNKIKYKYLSSDIVFKYIFGTNQNKKYTSKFLELFMGIPPDLLDDIIIENSIKLTPKTVKTRKYEMDIVVIIPKLNKKVIIEMQEYLNDNTISKNIIYLFSLIGKELKEGQNNFSKCPDFIEINLVKHFCGCLKGYEDEYYLIGKNNKKILKKNFCNIRIVNIDKYYIGCYNENIDELSMWLMLINAGSKSEIDKIWKLSKDYPMIREVIIKMNEFQGRKYVQELWLNDVLYRSEMQSNYDEGKTEGFKLGKASGFNLGKTQGFNEGEINKQYEIAKNLLENTKTTIEDISKCTGLSIKELNKLKNKVSK